MTTIIDFKQAKEDREPTLQGGAHCIDCGAKWTAVAPLGTRWLECSWCHGWKGTWDGPFEIEERFVCNCGNDLYLVGQAGCRCVACGAWATL